MVRSHRNQNRTSTATVKTRKTSRNRLRGVESLEMRRLMAADIGNYIWEDLNADGIQNESAIDGVNDIEVVLFNATDNSEVDFTFTENDAFGNPGFYEFSEVPDGSYYLVVFARRSGYVFTTQGAGSDPALDSDFDRFGKSATFTVSAGTTSLDFDAGLIPASISSFVWWDEDENGLQADIEGGIPGVTVQLLQNGSLISSDVTDSEGLYLVGRLPAGNYALKYLYPEGFDVASPSDVPSIINDLNDSDGLGPDLITAEFAVTTGGLITNVDQGFYKSPRVGDYVWRDTNNNGIQDEPASAGINGVSVSLFTDADVKVADEVTRNDRAGNPGYYEFKGVAPGQYYVRFFAPEGQVFTTLLATSTPLATSSERDSNAQANGQTALFTITRGSSSARASEEYSIDAGLRPIDLSMTASVSNLKPPVGSTVTYSVTVTNEPNLSAATGVTVKDILPEGFTYVSDNSGGFYNSTTRTWAVGTVESGTSRTIQVVATVTSGGTKTNVAQISSANEADFDSTPDNAPLIREDDDFTVSLTPSSKIGNYVWRDLNNDGIQNEPESAGVNGVVVSLFKSTGEQVAGPTQTANDADGKPGFYSFNDIDPGRYYVVFTAASGDTFTTRFATSGELDSNVDSSGRSDDFDLLSGVDEFSIDAGLSGIVAGACANVDFNGNSPTSGTLGNSLSFTSGSISVRASGFSRDRSTGAWSTAYLGSYGGGLGVTDSSEGNGDNDRHTVDNLGGRDNYVLLEFNQPVVIDEIAFGYVVADSDFTFWAGTVPNAFSNHQMLSDAILSGLYSEENLTTLTGARTADVNANGIFGNFVVIAAAVSDTSPEDRFKIGQIKLCTPGDQQPASIGDSVWHDLNGNGIRESTEPGIEGATVTLIGGGSDAVINGIDDTVATAITSSTGTYSFAGLTPGTQYRAIFALPAGYTAASPRKQGADSGLDSDGLTSDIIILGSGQSLNTIDAGFFQEVRVGNFVWNDLDMDGIQDSNETGIGGVTVNLTGTSGGGTAISRSTTTAADGSYQFSALPPGSYQVAVAASNFTGSGALSTYAASPTLVGTNRAIDSNVSPSSTSPVTLVSGSSDNDIDFGYYRTTQVCVNLFLEGHTATSGPAGNILTVSSGGISARVSGFSRDPRVTDPLRAWAPAYVGRFGGGLGVTDTSEGSGSGNAHTVDNIGRENYLLFRFSQAVTVDTAFLGYVAGDSDVRVWIGNANDAFNNHYLLSNAFLSSLGTAEVNLGAGLTRTADINAANATGNILVIAANTGELKPNDQFKVAELGLCAIVPMSSAGTKFFTVDDDANRTFKYGSVGNAMDNFAVVPTNPRGITANVSGSNVWIADHAGRIYNYTSAGAHVANWDSRISGLQGVTTNGTHIWTVSGSTRRVYYYPHGTTRANGSSVSPSSSFALNFYNSNPTDLTTDGRFIWVVNEGGTKSPDMVFKYTLSGSFLGRWQLDAANSRPTGITVDPAGGNKLWVVDNGTDRIYEYSGATGRVSGGMIASKSYALTSGNTNPQGIADPPGPDEMAEATESSLVVNEQYVDQEINPSFNALNAGDVNSDGVVSPLDALLVINRLNAIRRGVDYTPATWMFEDVSNDGVISPIDALLVINQLNRRQSSSEPPASQPEDTNPTDSDVSGSDESNAPNDDLGSGEGENGPTDAFFASYDPQLAAFSGGAASDRVSDLEDEERGLRRRSTIRLR